MFKINIATNEGKTYKLEAEAPGLINKELGNRISGTEISHDLEGYEFEIAGASDKAGFTSIKDVPGIGLKKVLLTYGKGMKKKPKGLSKKPVASPKGLRLRKTVRGRVISPAISQINLKITKQGEKKLSEIFPDQNKTEEEKPPEKPAEEHEEGEEEKEEKIREEMQKPEEQPKASEEQKEELARPDEEPKGKA